MNRLDVKYYLRTSDLDMNSRIHPAAVLDLFQEVAGCHANLLGCSFAQMLEKNLPLHIVEKKIPYIDESGELVKPEEPNGYKFESLILDMIHEMDSCLPYEVVRNREFAPIKNKTGIDSVESARELLKENGVEL